MGGGASALSLPEGFSSLDVQPFGALSSLDRASDIVDSIPASSRVVLLGECTHGTEEFYSIRAAVTKRLVEERGFSAVVFEADWPFMEAGSWPSPVGVKAPSSSARQLYHTAPLYWVTAAPTTDRDCRS